MNKKIIHSLIDAWAEKTPGSIAVEAAGGTIDYAALRGLSDHVGRELAGMGTKKGDVIGVYITSGIDYVCTILGINKAGAVFMPLPPGYPLKRLQYLVASVKPRFIVTTAAYKDSLSGLTSLLPANNCPAVVLPGYSGMDGRGEAAPLETDVSENDSNYIIYTSGSTGDPKMIEGAHKSLSHFIHWQMKEFGIGPGIRVSQLAPLSFDVSFRDIFLPLAAGGTLCIPPQSGMFDGRLLLKWFGQQAVSLVHIVPSVFRLLIREIEQDEELKACVRSLKYIFLAGEPLYYKDVMRWREVTQSDCQVVNLYGPSETTLAKLFYRIGSLSLHEPSAIVPLGIPISNTMVAIMNGDLLCGNGELGEIVIKTPFRSKGYFKDPALTAAVFVQNPLHSDYEDIIYRTGDLGKKQDDGTIVFLGRKDRQVKIRGNRVELQEIEHVVLKFPGVEQVLVNIHPKADKDLLLICYLIAGHAVQNEELLGFVRQYLPDYMLPSYIIQLASFPLNINGKIDRGALPKPEDLLYETKPYQAPSGMMEELLHGIWSEILGLKKIGVHHSFFEIGGQSLSATRVVSSIYKKLGTELSLKEFLENATISLLAKKIHQQQPGAYESIPPAPQSAYYPLSPSQRAVWLASQLEGYQNAYMLGGAYTLSVSPDKESLEKSFNAIIKRYEILRTVFVSHHGEPVQQVLRADAVHLGIDYTDNTSGTVEKPDDDQLHQYFQTNFNLAQWPLIRVTLIRKATDKYLLVFLMHHIITDAWSNKIFTREMLLLYRAFSQGHPAEIPLPSLQYKDYAWWVRQRMEKDGLHKAYWVKQLEGLSGQLSLPCDYAAQHLDTNKAGTLSFSLSQQASESIRKYCSRHDVSLFMLTVACLNLLLYKYCGKRDIVLGTPVSERNHPDLENQIGLFLNYLVLRTYVNIRSQFGEYLQEVKQTVLEAFEHQAYPFFQLAQDLHADRQANENPFYNVLIVMNNEGLNADENDIAGLKAVFGLTDYAFEHPDSKVDLSFFISDEHPLSFKIEYKAGLFKKDTIAEMGKLLAALLDTTAEREDATVGELIHRVFQHQEKKLLSESVDLIKDDF